MMFKKFRLEILTLLYALAYIPYVVVTRKIGTMDKSAMGRPLTGLEILPAMLISAMVFSFIFIAFTKWKQDVTRVKIGALSVPFADRWTFASGVCAAAILVAVPLSYTFKDVSVPFMQLLMRGDVLILAPLVDLFTGRKVRWWSWTALVLVAIGLFITLFEREGLHLPPLAIALIIVYTAAYFARLYIMTKISKNDDDRMARRYFSEEKIVSFPIALIALAVLPFFIGNNTGDYLSWGFVEIWKAPQLPFILLVGFLIFAMGIFSILILLDRRENSFCVPLERSASILAGIIGSIILAVGFGGRMPSNAEFIGAGLLILAMIVLSVGPRLGDNTD